MLIQLVQAQSQYTLTLWPVSSGGVSSGGAFSLADVSGKVGINAAPSSGGQFTLSNGAVAPIQPVNTPTTPVATPTPPVATPTKPVPAATTPAPSTPVPSRKVYLPVVQR